MVLQLSEALQWSMVLLLSETLKCSVLLLLLSEVLKCSVLLLLLSGVQK
jgi:hypothetical protein